MVSWDTEVPLRSRVCSQPQHYPSIWVHNSLLGEGVRGLYSALCMFSSVSGWQPAQYSCLENPRRKSQWATVHGVAEWDMTELGSFTFTSTDSLLRFQIPCLFSVICRTITLPKYPVEGKNTLEENHHARSGHLRTSIFSQCYCCRLAACLCV